MPVRTSTSWCQLALIAFYLLTATGCVATPSATKAAESPVAVGTFNIRYANPADGANAWQHRRGLVLDILREGDVWGLQEALPQQIDEITNALPEFTILTRSRERNPAEGEACPLLFRTARWSLDHADHGTFWLSANPDEVASRGWDAVLPRIVTYARLLEKGTGRGLYVYNAHFDHRGKQARLESARLLAQRIAARRHPDPVLVLGDFNTGPMTAPVQELIHASIGLIDAWHEQHDTTSERGTFNGWQDSLGRTRIDYVLVNDGVDVSSCWIDDRRPGGRWPSDHAPVRATLHLRP